MAENWSKALSEARGTWSKILCADDLLDVCALQSSVNAVNRNPNSVAVFGRRNIVNESGLQVAQPRSFWGDKNLISRNDLINKILRTGTNPCGEPFCVMWRTEMNQKITSSISDWNYYVDLEMWLNISKFGEIVHIPDQMGSFRVSKKALTARKGFAVVSEARSFFLNNKHFSSRNLNSRIRGLTFALARIIARKVFLSLRNG
jgi:hypothetical protein